MRRSVVVVIAAAGVRGDGDGFRRRRAGAHTGRSAESDSPRDLGDGFEAGARMQVRDGRATFKALPRRSWRAPHVGEEKIHPATAVHRRSPGRGYRHARGQEAAHDHAQAMTRSELPSHRGRSGGSGAWSAGLSWSWRLLHSFGGGSDIESIRLAPSSRTGLVICQHPDEHSETRPASAKPRPGQCPGLNAAANPSRFALACSVRPNHPQRSSR